MVRPGQIHRAATSILSPVAKIMGSIENALYTYCNNKKANEPNIVFIVGVPRSGTTLTYQCLTHCLEVNYPSNLTALFPDSPYLGLLLNKLLYKNRPHSAFNSVHGYSLGDGLYGPNEWETLFGWKIYPQLKENKASPLLDKLIQDPMQSVKYPMVFKTLNIINHREIIMQKIPNSRFIYVERNPLHVARSIYRAKKREGVLDSTSWYVESKSLENKTYNNPAEKICAQIKAIHRDFIELTSCLEPWQWDKISYSDLCNSPMKEIGRLKKWFGPNVEWRENKSLPKIKMRTSTPVENAYYEKIFSDEFKRPLPAIIKQEMTYPSPSTKACKKSSRLSKSNIEQMTDFVLACLSFDETVKAKE